MRYATALAVVMRVISILLLFMFDLLNVVDAQTDTQNFFVNPGLPGPNQAFSANPVWSIGSTQTIKWRTNYENFTVNLWQQDLGFQGAGIGPGPTIFSKANYDAEADGFDWVVQTFNFDLSESDVFFVWLTRPGVIGITSHYFNITKEATSSSSSSTAASSTASTASSGAASTSVSRTSAAAQATNSGPASPENNGISNGTKVGIGVGVGFGVAILVLLSAVVALMLRKRKKRRQPISSSSHMVDEVNRSFPGPRPPPMYSQEMEDNQMPFSAGHPKSSSGRRVELE